jgi:hypothetical protein
MMAEEQAGIVSTAARVLLVPNRAFWRRFGNPGSSGGNIHPQTSWKLKSARIGVILALEEEE